jgi:hypothetical protein
MAAAEETAALKLKQEEMEAAAEKLSADLEAREFQEAERQAEIETLRAQMAERDEASSEDARAKMEALEAEAARLNAEKLEIGQKQAGDMRRGVTW